MEMDLPTISNHDMCRNCGACCMGMMSPPTIDDPEDEAWCDSLPSGLREELDAHEIVIGQACLWFDETTRRCKHYEHRPPTCQKFVPGCDICHEDREAYLSIPNPERTVTDADEHG